MKKFLRVQKTLFAAAALFIFSPVVFAQSKKAEAAKEESKRTVITIENARTTQYEKDKETGHDVIILNGDVKVSVESGTTKNVIGADFIRYDRVSEMIYASGSVSLEQTTENSGGQTVTALSLMFNTSTLEGVFDDGRVVQTKSDALNLPSGSTLIVASDIFGRSESNTIAFKNGSLTFSDAEDPYWHINASRIWLLPGGEFAFFNALLYVGVVPVMYFPAFYYPKDELVFNPVFGYRQREGYFIQTTAYLYGRKPLESPKKSNSTNSSESDNSEKLKALFNFVRPSVLKEQKLEGLVLHNLDADYKGNTTNYFKIMGDYYSNLGIMVGLDGVYKPKKYVTDIELGAQFGFSNTVFKDGADYLPYARTGKKIQDKSNLAGFAAPFRYSGRFKLGVNKPFSLSLSLPVYSDPYFSDDFSDREETMDWISYATENANAAKKERTSREISSFAWNMNGSYSANLPAAVKPYLSSLSMNLTSSLAFSSITTLDMANSDVSAADLAAWKTYSPERKFYYPSQITPANVSAAIGGTIFSYPPEARQTVSKSVDFPAPLSAPDEFLTDEDKARRQKEAESSGAADGTANREGSADGGGARTAETADASGVAETTTQNAGEQKAPETKINDKIADAAFPALNFPSFSQVALPGVTFATKYTFKPSLSTQLTYSSTGLRRPDDFEWEKLRSSLYTVKIPLTIENTFSYGGNFFTAVNSYTFEPVFQKHPYISTETARGGYSPSEEASLKKTDYAAEKRDLTNMNSVSFKPFSYIDFIKDTGITWRSTVRIVRTEFIGTGDNPEWLYHIAKWTDEEAITVNALDFTLATNQLDGRFAQSLTLTTSLPPRPDEYNGALKFTFPTTVLTFETGIKKSGKKDDSKWVKQPFKQSLTVSLFKDSLKFFENYAYNLEDQYHDSLKMTLSWKALRAAYDMNYTYGYDFTPLTGWKARTEKEFLPYSFTLSYAPSTWNVHTWKNRVALGLGVSTSVVADFLRPTNSYFTFAPSVSFKIHEFLTLTFSATTRNSVIYRYFGNKHKLPGEENLFKDLLNSFRFDNEQLRKNSGFKLKSLNLSLTHDLRDWDLKMDFKISPQLKTENGKKYYDFNPYMSVSVVWRPMGAMKTEIVDDYGTWKLNP
ncbi:MAG: hypothetical protein ACTTKL_10955 [Treponema sp.]